MMLITSVSLVLFQNCGPALHSTSSGGNNFLNSNGMQTVFKCNPQAEVSPISIRRLTKYEYSQSIYLLASLVPTAELAAMKSQLAALLMSVPDDNGVKFDSDDTGISEAHTSSYLVVARGFAAEVFKNNARLKAFIGSCASTTTAPTAACSSAFLASPNATQILRRPLTSQESTQMIADMNGDWKMLISRLLMHPHFIFQIELEGKNIENTLLKISPYELASRISFHVVKQGPDAALLAKARDGTVMQNDVITAEVERLISAYPQQATYSQDKFFEGWLSYNRVAYPVAPVSAAEKAFTGGKTLLRTSLLNELQNMTRYYTGKGQGSFEDLLSSPYSFASDADLAGMYGVAPYNPNLDMMIGFPGKQRAGLMSRAAFLVSGSINTSPITRGLRVRRQFLCEELAPPPANIASMVRDPGFNPNLTTRERYTQKTASSACIGCHVSINPLGFVLEGFDGFGRARTVETVYDEQTGVVLNQLPVDPIVQPQIDLSDSRSIASVGDFHRLLADSGKARGCMIESFFQYVHHRTADRVADSCTLLEMDDLASSPKGMYKLFYETPLKSSFQLRKID